MDVGTRLLKILLLLIMVKFWHGNITFKNRTAIENLPIIVGEWCVRARLCARQQVPPRTPVVVSM